MIIHFLCPPLCCLFLLFDYLTFRLPRSSQQLVSKGRYPSALEKSYFFFYSGASPQPGPQPTSKPAVGPAEAPAPSSSPTSSASSTAKPTSGTTSQPAGGATSG